MVAYPPDTGISTPPRRRSAESGYSFVELVITVGMILVVTTWAMPSFLSYYRTAKVRAAAQTVSAYLNEGRQLAIRTNSPVCVRYTTSTVQFRQTTCAGTIMSVAGLSGASSNIRMPDGINLSSTASAIFGNLGNATTAATYTVTDPANSQTMTITVAASGRVTIP